MMVLVVYDISTEPPAGEYRLKNISKICKNYGQRVQNSVFECLISPSQLVELRDLIKNTIDEGKDCVRIYNLGNNWDETVEHFGSNKPYNPKGTLIV